MNVPDVETQAILALCHHQEGSFKTGCEACVFRSEAAVEHFQAVVASAIRSLDEP